MFKMILGFVAAFGVLASSAFSAPVARWEKLGTFTAQKIAIREVMRVNRSGVMAVRVAGVAHDVTIIRASARYAPGYNQDLYRLQGDLREREIRIENLDPRATLIGIEIEAVSPFSGSRGDYRVDIAFDDYDPWPRPDPRPDPRPGPGPGPGPWPDDRNFGAECVRAFTARGYDVNYGNRVGLCRRVDNRYALEAVRSATATGKAIPDSALMGLVEVSNPAGLRCIQGFTENGYGIDYGNRAVICSRTLYDTGGESVWEATLTRKSILDSTLQNLTEIRSQFGLGCVSSFTRNGYQIDYGNRARICNDFRSWNAVSALDSLTSRGGAVDDMTLMQISRY